MKKSIFLIFAAILCSMSIDAYAATQRYIYVGLSNNYHKWKDASQWGINHWGGTGGGVVPGSKITDLKTTFTHSGCTFHMYRMYVYDDNKNFEFKGSDSWWDCKKENISISGTTKNALLFRDNDGGDGGSPTFYQTNYQEESAVSLSASSNSVSVGEEVTLTPKLTSNAEYNEIKSTTYSVGTGATVSDGKFVATAAGTYTVTATITYNPKKFTGITKKVENITCEIVVSEVAIPHPVTGVTVAPTSVTIKQGATTTLTATVSPSNADDPSITWSSDNTSVATVVNGVVTAVAAGTANITVTTVDGGFTATCAVKVKPLQYTFYAINSAKWPTVAAHYWEGADGGSAWPGANMVKESETINGFDIYSITISSDFVNIMFTNQIDGDNNKKTADLTTEGNNGKYYDIKDAKWYASLSEVPVSYDYYLTGSLVGGWDPKQKGIEKDGELYKATFTDLAAGEYEFKITKGDWAQQWNYSNLDKAYEEVSEGKDGEGNPNGNIKIVTTAVKTITVNFDATANKISLEGLTPYVAPLTYTVTVPAGTEKCYIAGAMNGWNFQEMTATANANEFTIEIAGARETDGYKYACQASWDYVEKDKDGNDLAGNRTWKENDKVENWGKPVIVTYQLKGVGGWEQPGIELVQNPGNNKEYMLTCQAISATDAIKVVRLEDGVIKDYYGNGTVKDGVEVTVNYDGDGNITLPEGKYNFYFDTNESEKKLWIAAATDCVTEPETYTRTVTEGNYGTICLPYASSSYSGAEFYEVSWLQKNGETPVNLYLDQLEEGEQLEAGKPYIFRATSTELTVTYTGAAVEVPSPATDNNGLTGSFDPIPAGGALEGNYVIAQNKFWTATDEASAPANRAYINAAIVPTTEPAKVPGRRRVSLGAAGENAETGIDNIITTDTPVKVIENGQLIIIRNGEKFNVQGQKL